jgi:hypothetical protein
MLAAVDWPAMSRFLEARPVRPADALVRLSIAEAHLTSTAAPTVPLPPAEQSHLESPPIAERRSWRIAMMCFA